MATTETRKMNGGGESGAGFGFGGPGRTDGTSRADALGGPNGPGGLGQTGVPNRLGAPNGPGKPNELFMLLPIEAAKGVGPKTAAVLKEIGIATLGDLFYTLPRMYENYQAATTIAQLRPGKVMIRGKISDIKSRRAGRRRLTITEGVIRDKTGAIRTVWFNQAYRAKQFDERREYFFTGTYEFRNGRYALVSPTAVLAQDVEAAAPSVAMAPHGVAQSDPAPRAAGAAAAHSPQAMRPQAAAPASLQPIYSAHGELKPQFFRRIMSRLRAEFANIPDLLPFMSSAPNYVKPGARAEALYLSHFPESEREPQTARDYLAYEELFEMVLAARLNRRENTKLKALPLKFVASETKTLVENLPFELTGAQRRAAWDILQDLERPTPMNRLLQGDVGSGKTVVAALAAAQAVARGQQVALLAPTAILASQHFEDLSRLFRKVAAKCPTARLPRVALLLGSTKQKAQLKKQILSGEIDLVIGTHALLTDDTRFRSLALCIIDEQHRFGVNQRKKLLLKSTAGTAPHLLSMTATPIPRSLQLTLLGDLDVSKIDELPAGRQPITTKILPETAQTELVYPKMHELLAEKQQIYWICAAIDEVPGGGDGPSELTSAKRQANKLQKLFPKYRVGLLHGKMKPDEKDRIMADFAENKIQILVSTTVVEVGVNVPNANLMVVQNAEHYGLAQLHQLRGRVGRGDQPATCFLLTAGDARPSRRLRELEKSTDGFYLAEADLRLRGPGEIYGSLQHGLESLKIADLSDSRLALAVDKHVSAFLETGADLAPYPELARRIQRFQQMTTLN